MRHHTSFVNIPLEKGTISLKNRPRAVPWTSSSRNEQAYINYYNSFIEVTLKIVTTTTTSADKTVYVSLKKPEACIIERLDGSYSFLDPQTNQEMGYDISENIINESFYRCALDNCFCNRDKQVLDDFCPVWNGMCNFSTENGKASDTFKSTTDNLNYTVGDNSTVTWKAKVPMRLLASFAARNAFILTRNFVTKLYFNEYSSFIDKVVYNGADMTVSDVQITDLNFYYDMTILGPDETDIFDSTLLNIPSTKIERGYTSVKLPDEANAEVRVKFNDTLNFSPKMMVMFFTDSDDNMCDLVKIAPKYMKISTGGETNLNPSFDPDSSNNEPDYRLFLMTKQALDQNNLPCINYHNWKNANRYYIFSFAENFNLLDNNNYINYELRLQTDSNIKNKSINIHRVYLKDYLTVFESSED